MVNRTKWACFAPKHRMIFRVPLLPLRSVYINYHINLHDTPQKLKKQLTIERPHFLRSRNSYMMCCFKLTDVGTRKFVYCIRYTASPLGCTQILSSEISSILPRFVDRTNYDLLYTPVPTPFAYALRWDGISDAMPRGSRVETMRLRRNGVCPSVEEAGRCTASYKVCGCDHWCSL